MKEFDKFIEYCKLGNLSEVKSIYNRVGSNILKVKDSDGDSPLIVSIRNKRLEVALFLNRVSESKIEITNREAYLIVSNLLNRYKDTNESYEYYIDIISSLGKIFTYETVIISSVDTCIKGSNYTLHEVLETYYNISIDLISKRIDSSDAFQVGFLRQIKLNSILI